MDFNLTQAGHKVFLTSTAEAGLRAVRDHKPDVVLLDLMLPDMPGTEVCRRLKKGPETTEVKIIMVTAKAMRGDREKCLSAGASDYITKPVDMDQLRSLLRVWLYR